MSPRLRPISGSAIRRRTVTTAVLAVGLLLALTGCFKVDADMTVQSDDTVDGTMVVAISDEVTKMMDQMGDGATSTDTGVDKSELPKGAKIEKYAEGGYTGEKVTFSDVPIDEMNSDGMTLTRSGDTFTFTMDMSSETGNATGSGSGDDDAFTKQMEALAKPEFTWTVTFPGKVTSSNGSIDGNTVTWDYEDMKKGETFKATASATPSSPNYLMWGFAALTAVALAVAGIAGLAVLLRRRGGQDAGGADAAATAEQVSVGQTPAFVVDPSAAPAATGVATEDTVPLQTAAQPVAALSPAIAPGWYPTADGQTLRYHDGTAWTEHVRPAQ